MFICISARGIPGANDPLNGIFEFDQAKALAALNNKVIYVALDTRSFKHKRSYGFSVFEKDNVLVYLLSLPIGGVPTKYNNNFFSTIYTKIQLFFFSILMHRIIKKEGMPDIVHSHFLEISDYTSIYCNKHNLPIVITEHWSFLNKEIIPKYIVKKAQNTYKRATECLCVSTSFAKRLLSLTGCNFKVVPNIVCTDEFYFQPRRINREAFSFVSCGALDHRKGHDILIKAFKKVHDIHPESNLRIIGGGGELKNLKDLSCLMSLQDNVQFCGELTRDKIKEIYNDCDAFVLASRIETFGVVYIEAMATGLPVIATICGGPEFFVTTDNGLLVPVDDEKSLSIAMINMIETIDKYNGEKIAELSKEMFSPNSIATQLLNIYTDCLSNYA